MTHSGSRKIAAIVCVRGRVCMCVFVFNVYIYAERALDFMAFVSTAPRLRLFFSSSREKEIRFSMA